MVSTAKRANMPKQQKGGFQEEHSSPSPGLRNAVRCRMRKEQALSGSERIEGERGAGRVARYVQVSFFVTDFSWGEKRGDGLAHRMPESARALCRMVSLTAAKTRRMLDVSVAWVRLDGVSFRCDVFLESDLGFTIHTYWGYRFKCARLTWLKRHSRYLAARLTSLPPE